jgi:hypothetical protein
VVSAKIGGVEVVGAAGGDDSFGSGLCAQMYHHAG